MSSSIPATYPFLNGPLINTITGCVVQIQERKILTRKRLHSLIHYSSITTGFFVLLYFLIHIQILFFWFLKLIFRIIFKIVSTIFWLPLRTARFFTPKTIDYDILFPLFWLCSISSFYLSKFFHENICQFYDQHLVRRYKIFNYNQAKRDDIKRYLFILTFILLLILQSVFILIPIAASIRRHNENTKVSLTPAVDRQTMTITSATVKSAATEAVETMNENLYNRFIDAFKDETESHKNKKRQPLIEHTGKKIQKSFKNQINNLKPTNKQNKTNQDNKSSRFQRWIIHYLKAPFQKWESKKHEDINTKIEKKNFEDENEEENIELSSSSSIISDTDENNDEDDETDDQEEHSTITKQIQQRIDTIKHFGHKLKENVKSKISSKEEEEDDDDDDDDDDEDEDDSLSSEERLTKAIETAKNIGAKIIKTKFSSSTVDDDEESGYESDDEEEKQSSKLPEKVKKALAASIITVKNVAANIKNKIVSSTDEEDEQSTPITEQIKEHIGKPIEDKLSSLTKHDESENDLKSFIEHKKESIEKEIKSINDTISASVDHLKQTIANRVDSAEDFFSNTFEKSSKFLKESIKQIPKSNEVLSKIKEQIVEPIESKISHAKEVINTKHQHLKETTDDEIKSLKKKKKEKTLTEKEKDKLKSLNKIAHEKISRHEKKKQTIPSFNKKKIKLKIKRKLNGYFDDAWNIWHLAKRKLAHIFTSSTKHARHLPRYNTTSLYTAYTDLKCYDYIKQLNRYRLLKRKHLHFLDTYRHHSPFPVYLSILKSNGPRCYRHYPNSSCALVLKSSNRNFKTQLYRFARFWAIIGILVIILAAIYAALTDRKQTYFSLFHHQEDSNRSSKNKQRTTMSNKNDLSKSTTAIEQKTSSSINQQTVSSNTKTDPLNQQIEKHLRLWLQNEKNDGFRNLSEACRIAINNTFLKKHEQLSVETLQFANAKIRDVSQTNNNNNSETPAEKIVINAVLDIDHLIINIINTFREQHFSVETPKLSGQLYILLVINPNQYSIEANLQQLHLNPVNIIDPNNTLLTSEKQSIIRLLDETINRTTVRCSFRLSDHQDDTNYNTLYNSAVGSYPDSNKIYSSNNQPSSLSIQSVGSRSRESNYTRYQLSEPPPTLLINDTTPYLYTKESEIEKEPKRLLVRIVKAVKLHDVEQPYCILELNHPKQIKQTDTAKNGLNPFWDERFVFECNEQSNQIRLQIIDRKKSNTRTGNNYG
ncbi:unnamed protein product [Rotaria sp. Silwood2]|nr:unnamed protein product [Rotaria sp. Silwood2]